LKNNLFIIPARKNSTRLYRKNHALLGNMTLLKKRILNIRKANIGSILVTSDDEEFLKKAIKCKVDYIRNRPDNLKGDGPSLPIVIDAIQYFERVSKIKTKYIFFTQITTPFVFAKDFKSVYSFLIKNKNIDRVVSCKKISFKFDWYLNENKNKLGAKLLKQEVNKIKNIIKNKNLYLPNGGFFAFKRPTILNKLNLYKKPLKIWEMSNFSSIDIDYKEDLLLAEAINEKKLFLKW